MARRAVAHNDVVQEVLSLDVTPPAIQDRQTLEDEHTPILA